MADDDDMLLDLLTYTCPYSGRKRTAGSVDLEDDPPKFLGYFQENKQQTMSENGNYYFFTFWGMDSFSMSNLKANGDFTICNRYGTRKCRTSWISTQSCWSSQWLCPLWPALFGVEGCSGHEGCISVAVGILPCTPFRLSLFFLNIY